MKFIRMNNKIEAAEQPTNYYRFRRDLPEQQVTDIKVGQEVWFEPRQVEDNISNVNIVKEIKDSGGHIEDHGIVKEIMSWPYDNYPYYKVEVNDGIVVEVATVYDSKEKRDLAANRSFSEKFIPVDNDEFHKNSAEQPTTPKPTATLPDNMVWAWDPKGNQWIAVMKDNPVVTPPTYNPNNLQNTSTTTTQMYTPIKSTLIDSLNQFLDGDKYSREIKIEKGLISDGLIKFAGINPIKGPKYSITEKGLEFLKKSAQEEYNFEKDYIKARKSYLLDGITKSEFKSGAPESQGQMPKFSIFEKDGSELAQIEANNETDAKVKFFMENPEYEGSQTISVKKVDSSYCETTNEALSYPNQSISPSTDIKVDPHGWVNMAADENIDKKQTILKNLVYQHNKQNGEESTIGLSLDFDNKAVATGDLESLSKLEDQLREEEIHCNITPRKDFPEMYELTVFYNLKSAPTDKFAALKKKANGPFEFEATKDSIDFIIDKEFLIKLINAEPELKDTKLDPKKNEFDYIVDYKLSSNIEWKIDFETREYGIKNMSISVPWQTISIDIEYSPKSEAAPIKNDMSFSIRHDIIGVDIAMESENFNSIWMKGLQIEGEDNVKATF